MIIIQGRKVGKEHRPFVIAEISANHGGDIQRAKNTILAAKASGVDAVKIQSYTPDTMTINSDKPDFQIKDGLWKGYSLYELYEEAYTPFDWHAELFEFSKKNDLTLFSTPFDESAVDLLCELNTPAFKIASFEITDTPLLEYVAAKGKPLLISTGMASHDEIAEAVEACFGIGNHNLLLFHCISNYPAHLEESSLGDIAYLEKHFKVDVGLSDHTLSNVASTLAVAKGAVAIEKHFKLDDGEVGPDTSFSILPDQMRSLCDDCRSAFIACQSTGLLRTEGELKNKIFRRSIYFVRDLKKGETVKETDIRRIRPGFGLDPKHFNFVVGKVLKNGVEKGQPVSFDDLIY